MISKEHLNWCVCPNCFGELVSKSAQPYCEKCRQKYPLINGIPILVSQPDCFLSEWRFKVGFQLNSMAHELSQVQAEILETKSALTKERLERHTVGLEHNLTVWNELTKSLMGSKNLPVEKMRALKAELPLAQTLMGYESNIYRDWGWGDEENKLALETVIQASKGKDLGARVLILGAGAGRLAADLSRLSGVEIVVALDIHPFMLMFGNEMSKGHQRELYEFPIAPLSADSTVKKVALKDPQGASGKVMWLAADGLNPPFKESTFDTVVTPWFIDVVPLEIDQMASNINFVLRTNGHWINFGPYGFVRNKPKNRWSQGEIVESFEKRGFKASDQKVSWVPYMNSPFSAQKRTESVFTFSAQKISPQPRPAKFSHVPTWAIDWNVPVPMVDRLIQYRSANEIQLLVLKEIDGHKSITELAKSLSRQLQVEAPDSEAAVATLLRQIWMN